MSFAIVNDSIPIEKATKALTTGIIVLNIAVFVIPMAPTPFTKKAKAAQEHSTARQSRGTMTSALSSNYIPESPIGSMKMQGKRNIEPKTN